MSTAPDIVYLHIGLHKTGTTYLQNVLRANRELLLEQRVDFPGGPGGPVQAFAVWDLQGRRPRGADDARIAGSWTSLVDAVNISGCPTALISEERLSLSTRKQVRQAVSSFPDSDVHVVVTARDLGRVAVSAWQEEVKNDQTWTWQEFVDAVKDPDKLAVSPARGFWLRQDLVTICQTWESAVPPERLHLVTVPQSGSSPQVLLDRFASVVGFDASVLTEQPAWNNETVGVAATEVLRRVNERLDRRLNQRQYDRVIKLTVVQMLAKRTEPVRFTLPAEELPWAIARAAEMITALRSRPYAVVGDLDELRPQHRPGGRRPDDATDVELLEAAVDGLALLAERYAATWWLRKKADVTDSTDRPVKLASAARGAVFRTQRRAADLADRSPTAARAMSLVSKATRRTPRAADRGGSAAPPS
ncbi:MAG: hypothetical protein ACR2LE_09155 [Nocardioidaceae bacterium]